MFALIAVICFAIDFILNLMGTSTGKIDLIALGLAFVALHLVTGVWPLPRLARRE